MSNLAETSFNYEAVVWTCVLLPYRIIVCRDAIQYIVQVRNEKAYRNLSYFSGWEPIERHYPQLAMAGLPLNSPDVLSHEVKRRVMRLGYTAADRAIRSHVVPKLEQGS